MKRQLIYGVLALLLLVIVFFGVTGNSVYRWVFVEEPSSEDSKEQFNDAIASSSSETIVKEVPITYLVDRAMVRDKNSQDITMAVMLSEPKPSLLGWAVLTPTVIHKKGTSEKLFSDAMSNTVKGGKYK